MLTTAAVPADDLRHGWRYTPQAARLLRELVAGGAALGWQVPPDLDEVAALLAGLGAAAERGDARVVAATDGGRLVGFGYWQRYERPTHRQNADLQKVAVLPGEQRRGIGEAVVAALVGTARAAGVEVLTLDARGDNEGALRLYRRLGFLEYGRLPGFVSFGGRRYDKIFCYLDLRPGTSGDG